MANLDDASNRPAHALELDHVHPEYQHLTAGEHKTKAYAKLSEWIKNGTANAQRVVDRIMNEVPTDRIVPASRVEYIPAPNGVRVALGDVQENVHKHALGQIAARAGIPLPYVNTLNESDWGRDLLARNLNQLHAHMDPKTRMLARSVNGELRGWLSDRYRRLDARPILDATMGEIVAAGGQIVDGIGSDTKLSLRVIVPKVIEVVPGDYAVLGFGFNTSDYGDGPLSFTSFLTRLICLNGAMRESALRMVHLGGKLAQDVAFSERTYQLDSETTASASRDLVKQLLSAEKLEELSGAIRTANAEKIDPKAALAALRSRNAVSKAEGEKLAETYNSPDIEVLPPGQTKWRFSNAISFLAGQTADAGRRMELERLAGEVF